MPTFVLRLIAPRPNFAQALTESEREIMGRHAAHWRTYLDRGDRVVFGPVLTEQDSYGLAVVETDDEQALREFAAEDPVVTSGTAVFEVGRTPRAPFGRARTGVRVVPPRDAGSESAHRDEPRADRDPPRADWQLGACRSRERRRQEVAVHDPVVGYFAGRRPPAALPGLDVRLSAPDLSPRGAARPSTSP